MKTYWYKHKDYPNLGDELNHIIVDRLFGRSPERALFQDADLVSVGSVLGWIWDYEYPERSSELHVVGSGFIAPGNLTQTLPFLRVHSVRGYLTKQLLRDQDDPAITLGDPGLLTPDLVRVIEPRTKNCRYGVVLHARFSEDEAVKRQFEHLPVGFINIRTENIDDFVSELLRYDVILSQSLHGLIIADSLGIPNVWLNAGNALAGGSFKFFDYFSSVGRDFYQCIFGVPRSILEIERNIQLADSNRVAKVQSDIVRAYEDAFSEIEAQEGIPEQLISDRCEINPSQRFDFPTPLQNLKLEISGVSESGAAFKDLLLQYHLVDSDGQKVDSNQRLRGVSYSSNQAVGHYRYLEPLASKPTVHFLRLNDGLACEAVSIRKWNNRGRQAVVSSIVVTEL